MPKVRRGDVTWVEPTLVAQVEFAEWTRDGRLRAPVYLGLREDKLADEVVAEHVPMPSEIRRGARVLKLSNLDKPFWPDEGITKGDLLAFYRDIAPVLVPHLRDRPFTMKRYPDGWQGKFFFQKDAPSHMPDWIKRAPFPASTRDGEKRIIDYPLVNDDLALLWMVNMGCIDMNAWASRVDKPDRPDWVMFDLDPSDDVGFPEVIEVALLVKQLLDLAGLESFPKTSGSRGIHVLVPIARRQGFDAARSFAAVIAGALERTHPGLVTTEWTKRKRRGVLVDANQNGPGKTTAVVYSVRPRAGATVSTPLAWDEVHEGLDPTRVHDGRGSRQGRPPRRPLRAGARAASVARGCAALDRLSPHRTASRQSERPVIATSHRRAPVGAVDPDVVVRNRRPARADLADPGLPVAELLRHPTGGGVALEPAARRRLCTEAAKRELEHGGPHLRPDSPPLGLPAEPGAGRGHPLLRKSLCADALRAHEVPVLPDEQLESPDVCAPARRAPLGGRWRTPRGIRAAQSGPTMRRRTASPLAGGSRAARARRALSPRRWCRPGAAAAAL